MKRQYAITQVCEVSLNRYEIETIVAENLIARGGDPSYDFATSHPIFVWSDKGDLAVRFVQGAVVAREQERFLTLKPVPTEQEINTVMANRVAKLEKA